MSAGRRLATVVVLVASVSSASAQDNDPALRPHRFTLSAGGVVSGGYPAGDQSAELRRNAAGDPAQLPLDG